MGSFFYWYSLCYCDREYPLKYISVINRDGWLDEVPGEFYPVCGFFLFDSLCFAKNFPYRIFRFLARIKKTVQKWFFGSVEFLYYWYEIQDAGMMTEGTVPVPPYRPCAKRWWRSTCSGVIALGEPQRRRWNHLERMLIIEHFYRVVFFKTEHSLGLSPAASAPHPPKKNDN